MSIDIETIQRRLLIKYPLFGSVLANISFVEDINEKTASTDGEVIYYNPSFLSKLNQSKQTFLFAHEVAHIAFNHIFRSDGKNPKIWNIATDAVINALLMKDGLELIDGVVNIPEAINYDAEEMYEKLLEDEKNNSQNGDNQEISQNDLSENSSSNNSSNNNGDKSQSSDNGQSNSNNQEQNNPSEKKDNVGHDDHSLWKKAIEKKKQKNNNEKSKDNASEEKNNSQNGDNQDNPQNNPLENSSSNNLSNDNDDKSQSSENNQNKNDNKQNDDKSNKKDDIIDKLTKLGEKETFKQNKIERKKQLEELRNALASQSHGFGNDTNSESRKITNIGTSEALIDWRMVLKESINLDVDWSYRNAQIEDGILTPYLEEMPYPETEIVLDTSGSINETLLRNFLRECKNILQTSKVKVGCFDTKFYGFTEIKSIYDIDKLDFKGGGGTNFDVAVNAFSMRVENKIIFTDGEANMPQKIVDAIWIVFGGKKISPKGGKVINISSEQLNKLRCEDTKGKSR